MKAKKLLSAILAVAMLLGTMCFTVSAENGSVDTWDGTADTSWYDSKNVQKEYVFETAEQLAGLAKIIDENPISAHLFVGVQFKLAADLDLANIPWTPIGSGSATRVNDKCFFKGSFDGQGHTISNLNVTKEQRYGGLFGQVAKYDYSTVFENVTIHNAKLRNDSNSKSYAGALVGRADGSEIRNCHLTGTVDILGYSFVGGLVGHSHAVISECSVKASGSIVAKNWQCGGLVGSHTAKPADVACIEDSSVVGENGTLSISSYNGSIGGVVGSVTLASGATSAIIDNLFVSDVQIDTVNASYGVGYVACGYDATNAMYKNVTATSNDETIVPDDAAVAKQVVAEVNGISFASLTDALTAAQNGDVVYVYPGTYTDEIVVNKSIVLTGDPAYGADLSLQAVAEKPVIKISDVTNGGVKYYTKNIVFDNLVFDVAENATGATWNVSALGYYYENTAPKEGLTVTNCDFINNSNISMSAVAANISKYAVKNNTFKNFTTAVHSYVDHGAVDEVVISGNVYAGVENIANVYYGEPATGNATIAITDNKSTDGSVAKIAVDDFGQTKATPATAYNKVTVSGNDGALVMHNYGTNSFTLEESGNAKETVYSYRNEEILTRLADQVPQSNVYVQYGTDNQQAYVVNKNGTIVTAEKVELVFEKADGAKDLKNSVWNLVLRSSDDELINRLNSADFTFELTAEDDMDYEIVETNSEIEINNVNNLKDRYEFHFKNKNNVADTATEITIGQVRFTGYGKFSFIVKDETTNAVHATTLKDNIVASYAVSSLIVNNTDENGDNDKQFGTINSEIIAPTSDLIINIDFPNAVANKTTAYQSMKVTVTGEDIKDIVFDLGSELETPDVDQPNKSSEAYTVSFDGGYRIAIKNVLTQNTAYDIKVEGAGYRTAHYTVNMQETDSKTINFWNNVKDAEADVEAGKMKQTKNFLAGDIVKDSKINTYDLSAVVSYFGETDLVGNNNAYAKYDLNRDGLIDSKDVAIVLVSWGN